MTPAPVASLTTHDVETELESARVAIERGRFHQGLRMLHRARTHLDGVPLDDPEPHLFASFMAADRHLDEADRALFGHVPTVEEREAVRAGGRATGGTVFEQRRTLRRSLRSLQSTTTQLGGRGSSRTVASEE